jgi:hypothetical protein
MQRLHFLLVIMAASLHIPLASRVQYTSMSAQDKYSDHKFLAGPSTDAGIGTRIENYRILGLSVLSLIHVQGGFGNRPRG